MFILLQFWPWCSLLPTVTNLDYETSSSKVFWKLLRLIQFASSGLIPSRKILGPEDWNGLLIIAAILPCLTQSYLGLSLACICVQYPTFPNSSCRRRQFLRPWWNWRCFDYPLLQEQSSNTSIFRKFRLGRMYKKCQRSKSIPSMSRNNMPVRRDGTFFWMSETTWIRWIRKVTEESTVGRINHHVDVRYQSRPEDLEKRNCQCDLYDNRSRATSSFKDD